MTPLDQAYVAAMQDETKQLEYYNLLLNTELFMPIYDIPENGEEQQITENDTISPLILVFEDEKYLVLFDTQEKLTNWVEGGIDFEIGVVGLPGHAVIEMMSTDINWALNVGTEHTKTFVPDELELLKELVVQSESSIH